MPIKNPILRIAVFSPLRQYFDYLPPLLNRDVATLLPGMRVRVPFGKRKAIGILLEVVSESTLPREKLKAVEAVLDEQPLLSPALLQLYRFASDYYQHPLGDVLANALPTMLRTGKVPKISSPKKETKEFTNPGSAGGSPALFSGRAARAPRKIFNGAGEVDCEPSANAATQKKNSITLNPTQQFAIDTVIAARDHFTSFLLNGVTGSGKTEVYLQIIAKILAENRQALVLLPEIALTPQTVARFRERFAVPVVVFHSGLTERERALSWLQAKNNEAAIVIGTRSAVFTPLAKLGVIIVDEEHDLSFKQQEGFRYHARDLAVKRAQLENIPIVLGSATPALESVHNVSRASYQLLSLPERAGNALTPTFQILDLCKQHTKGGLAIALLERMQQHLDQGNQVLLFLNRRGYAPIVMCHQCGWTASCERCDAKLTMHRSPQRLLCHHCAAEYQIQGRCKNCEKTTLFAFGVGTEKLQQTLHEHFMDTEVIRLDRDTTRRKGSLENLLTQIHQGGRQILVGTQMLAKGHHFPNVTLVAIVDADAGLLSADFRGCERMGQLLLQVAGRAGRAEKPGEVIIQTYQPQHFLLRALIERDYAYFQELLIKERAQAALPPFAHLALLRADALQQTLALEFLTAVRQAILPAINGAAIHILGPIPALMEKRANRYRAQLLFSAKRRNVLQQHLPLVISAIADMKTQRALRWSLDVDPMEMY